MFVSLDVVYSDQVNPVPTLFAIDKIVRIRAPLPSVTIDLVKATVFVLGTDSGFDVVQTPEEIWEEAKAKNVVR